MPAPTGAHTTLWYLWEDNGFAQSPNDSNNKPFGADASMTTLEGSNNAVEIFEPNDRQIAQLIAQHFDGAFTVEFTPTNPWWAQGLLGAPSTVDNGDGTHTHTFDSKNPTPMQITAGYEDLATGSSAGPAERTLAGGVVQSATIDVAVEDTATVSLQGAYIDENWDDSISSLTTQPSLQHDAMTFAEATISVDGSTLSLVQDYSLEVQANVEIKRELGTRLGVDYSPKQLVPSVDYTKIRENHDEVKDLYGDSAATSVQEDVVSDQGTVNASLDNGVAAGSGQNIVDFIFASGFSDSASTENLGDPREDLQESINRRLRQVSVEATNETATAL